MRQQFLILVILFSALHSYSDEIENIYSEYEKVKNTFYSANINRNNASQALETYKTKTSSYLEKIELLEDKDKTTKLSPEGNQLAYDLEIIEPLSILINGKFDKASCDKAYQLNESNTDLKNIIFKKIKSIIQNLCR